MRQGYYNSLVKKINIIRSFFLLGIFVLPFVFWPWLEIPYEIPKVWFFQRWVEGLGFLGVLGVLRRLGRVREIKERRENKGDERLVWGVVFFLVIAVFSSLTGVDPFKSFWGNYYRGDGLLSLFHLAGLFFFLNLFWEESWWEPLVKTVMLSSILLSFWTIFLGLRYWGGWGSWGDWGKWGGVTFEKGIGATFGNPNFLAGYLLVTLPLTALEMRNLGGLRVLGITGVIGAIFLTGSRAGILGVLGWGILEAVGRIRRIRRTKGIRRTGRAGKLGLVGLLGILGILGVLGLLGVLGKGAEKNYLPESRERIFRKGIIAFTKKPFLGWGWANFDYAFASADWPMKFNSDVYVDKAHSNLLEILVTTGVIGLIGQMGLIGLGIRGLIKENRGLVEEGRGNKGWKRTLFLVFVLYLFHSQTNVVSINEEMIFWLILGIAGKERIVKQGVK